MINRYIYLTVINILFISFLIIMNYLSITELNLHILYFFICIFLSFTREIIRLRYYYLIKQQIVNNIDNRHSLWKYSSTLCFLKIINILNICLLIINQEQYNYINYKIALVYYIYDIVCMYIEFKSNIRNNVVNPVMINTLSNSNGKVRYTYKIPINESEYNIIELCYICYERKGDHTILNCNHDMLCHVCITKLDKCPICRKDISEIIQLSIE